MTSKHERLVLDYSEPHRLRQSLQYFCDVPQITEVYTEKSLREIFGIDSDKLPDICAIAENNHAIPKNNYAITKDNHIYIGEVKGKYLNNNVKKAQKQVIKYITTVRDAGWNCTGFIIVGFYWELIEDTSMFLN